MLFSASFSMRVPLLKTDNHHSQKCNEKMQYDYRAEQYKVI